MPAGEPRRDQSHSQQEAASRPAAAEIRASELPEEEHPMGLALFRVMRALVFNRTPRPEMDSLPLAQLRLFWAVSHCPEATMTDLSERLGVSQSTVTQLADRLVNRGMIVRQDDANDRRIVRLRLSEAGQKLLEQDKQEDRRRIQRVWDALSEPERAAVMQGLETLGRVAEQVQAAQELPSACSLGPPELPEEEARPVAETAQPVLDLLRRPVRGRQTAPLEGAE
jgi:DNA-binding MarR family transcriptional regulator